MSGHQGDTLTTLANTPPLRDTPPTGRCHCVAPPGVDGSGRSNHNAFTVATGATISHCSRPRRPGTLPGPVLVPRSAGEIIGLQRPAERSRGHARPPRFVCRPWVPFCSLVSSVDRRTPLISDRARGACACALAPRCTAPGVRRTKPCQNRTRSDAPHFRILAVGKGKSRLGSVLFSMDYGCFVYTSVSSDSCNILTFVDCRLWVLSGGHQREAAL